MSDDLCPSVATIRPGYRCPKPAGHDGPCGDDRVMWWDEALEKPAQAELERAGQQRLTLDRIDPCVGCGLIMNGRTNPKCTACPHYTASLLFECEMLEQRLKEAEAERDSLVMARAEAISERSRATLLERKLSEAVSQEREACATLCASMAASIAGTVGVGCSMCERAIRERSKP